MLLIGGEEDEKLNVIIQLLLSRIKYLTIITENKASIMNTVNKIYQETGLSIRIAVENKNVYRDIDLIINLNNFYELKSSYKLKSNAIIINYSGTNANWTGTENNIINKVDIGLPDSIKNKIDSDIIKEF